MFSLGTLIMVCAIVFCVGGLFGVIISRTLIPPKLQRDLEQRLQESRRELDQYQQDVAQHFAETSQLVTNLTQSYKEVHDHLAKGAIQLTNSEISKKMLASSDTSFSTETREAIDEVPFEQPRDWAPKEPGQTGMLSEEFGLEKELEEPIIEVSTAGGQKQAG